jgi:hypothetical protein
MRKLTERLADAAGDWFCLGTVLNAVVMLINGLLEL